jgi:hypothetical protein
MKKQQAEIAQRMKRQAARDRHWNQVRKRRAKQQKIAEAHRTANRNRGNVNDRNRRPTLLDVIRTTPREAAKP